MGNVSFDPTRSYKYRELYAPAMEITDPDAAAQYLEALITYHMARWNSPRDKAERIERGNLGYFAGYYDMETMQRVERLFKAVHPVFGSTANGPIDPNELIRRGKERGGPDA